MTFAAGNSDWVDHAKWKQAYFAALDKQIKGDIISWSRENGKIAIDGTNGKKKLFTTLFEKKDGKITNIKLEPYGQLWLEIKSSWSYMYEDVSMLDGQLTEKELKAYVWLTSNTPTSDKDWWEISKKEWTDLVNIIKKVKPKTASTPVDPIKK
jgi:hypothetical protein